MCPRLFYPHRNFPTDRKFVESSGIAEFVVFKSGGFFLVASSNCLLNDIDGGLTQKAYEFDLSPEFSDVTLGHIVKIWGWSFRTDDAPPIINPFSNSFIKASPIK